MIEFYDVFKEILILNEWGDEVELMKDQIYFKRKPLDETKSSLEGAGFNIVSIQEDHF